MDYKGEFYLIIYAAIISSMGIFTRLLDNYFGPFIQVSLRLIIAAVIIFVFFSFKGISWKISFKELILLFVAGSVGYGLMVSFIVLAYLNTTYAITTTLLQLSAIFILIGGAAFLKEKIKVNAIISMIIAILGVLLIFRPTLSNLEIGGVFAIGSAIFYSIYILTMRKLKDLKLDVRLFYPSLFGGLILTPFIFDKASKFILGLESSIIVIFFALLNVIAYLLLNKGLQTIPANIAGILLVFEVVFGIIIGILYYKEVFSMIDGFGAFLIIISVIILNLKNAIQTKNSASN